MSFVPGLEAGPPAEVAEGHPPIRLSSADPTPSLNLGLALGPVLGPKLLCKTGKIKSTNLKQENCGHIIDFWASK